MKGTDAAREASDMVLTDDNFVSIGSAVREGRKIFDNLKKGIRYYLAVKVALVLIFLLPIILNVPLPFAPIQIILLEMFMDIAASSGFVAEGMEPDTMKRPPKDPKEKILNKPTLDSNLRRCRMPLRSCFPMLPTSLLQSSTGPTKPCVCADSGFLRLDTDTHLPSIQHKI